MLLCCLIKVHPIASFYFLNNECPASDRTIDIPRARNLPSYINSQTWGQPGYVSIDSH